MTHREISARMGKAFWLVGCRETGDELSIPVEVTDHRQAYGRDRWTIRPIGGAGERNVESDRLVWGSN
jgi:hypothetical protein